jgi:hypothetical protein
MVLQSRKGGTGSYFWRHGSRVPKDLQAHSAQNRVGQILPAVIGRVVEERGSAGVLGIAPRRQIEQPSGLPGNGIVAGQESLHLRKKTEPGADVQGGSDEANHGQVEGGVVEDDWRTQPWCYSSKREIENSQFGAALPSF